MLKGLVLTGFTMLVYKRIRSLLKGITMTNAETYFRYLVNEIHTTIVATVDDEGLPVTAAIPKQTRSSDRSEDSDRMAFRARQRNGESNLQCL